MQNLSKMWSDRVLSVLRFVTALLFMSHGMQKILGFPAPARVPFNPLSLGGVAGLLELIGGALLLFGIFTRPVAFVLSGEMAFAYFLAHAPRTFWPLVNGGELAALYCFVFLYLAIAGGGSWSVDRYARLRSTMRTASASKSSMDTGANAWRPEDESNVRPAP